MWRDVHASAIARARELTFARDLPDDQRQAALTLARQSYPGVPLSSVHLTVGAYRAGGKGQESGLIE